MKTLPLSAFLLSALAAGCGGSGDGSGSSCSLGALESDMDATLSQTVTDADFTYAIQRADGRRYVYDRGASTLQTLYESASTSKLVSALIVLRQIERGALSLNAHPQDYIAGWSIAPGDPLYPMTLEQLLSFTAGLTEEPACINDGQADFERCVAQMARANAGNGLVPGSEFYYASTYLQVAGLMAVKARGAASWQTLYAEFQQQTGLFPNSAYDLPSTGNPRLAGGMHWTGEDYLAFLQALQTGSLLNAATMSQMLADHTAAPVMIVNSPALNRLGEDWHYGLGLWQECQSPSYDCTPGTRVSSPGTYGAYPFWDRAKGYVGIVARQRGLGNSPDGIAVERAVRPQAEAWVQCP
jgi:CubicO group peptidase (beta-lactamase class C family)